MTKTMSLSLILALTLLSATAQANTWRKPSSVGIGNCGEIQIVTLLEKAVPNWKPLGCANVGEGKSIDANSQEFYLRCSSGGKCSTKTIKISYKNGQCVSDGAVTSADIDCNS